MDDGSLFYRVYNNFMAYGWSQKFKCGAIESYNNVKAFVDIGDIHFDAGCTTEKNHFYPNLWHNDTMIHLGATNFSYRQCWGSDTQGHDWDKSQVQNNTIYLQTAGMHAQISCLRFPSSSALGCPQSLACKGKTTVSLPEFQQGGDEPGSREVHGYPSTAQILEWAREAIGTTWDLSVHAEAELRVFI